MVVFFNLAARVFLIRHKAAFNRLRPDDSILLLICIPGRFDNEIVRDSLKDFADQFWPRDAIGDGAVGVDISILGDVSVGEVREAAILDNADPPVGASELLDHAYRNFHGVVDDVVLTDRVHAVDGQVSISVEAYPGGHGRLERIALFARQAMVVAGRVHIEAPVHQVVDVFLSGCELE